LFCLKKEDTLSESEISNSVFEAKVKSIPKLLSANNSLMVCPNCPPAPVTRTFMGFWKQCFIGLDAGFNVVVLMFNICFSFRKSRPIYKHFGVPLRDSSFVRMTERYS